jgi:two-component system, OmpR family, response regulator
MTKKQQLVFLVDDDERYLDALEHNLKLDFKNGVKVEKYSSGDDCLKNMHKDPAVVILDYYLTGSTKTGIDVLKKIKKEKPEAEVVMLSGHEKLNIAVNCVRNGAYDYVVKNESAFVRTGHVVKNLLNVRRIRKESRSYEKWNWLVGSLLFIVLLYGVYFHLRYELI